MFADMRRGLSWVTGEVGGEARVGAARTLPVAAAAAAAAAAAGPAAAAAAAVGCLATRLAHASVVGSAGGGGPGLVGCPLPLGGGPGLVGSVPLRGASWLGVRWLGSVLGGVAAVGGGRDGGGLGPIGGAGNGGGGAGLVDPLATGGGGGTGPGLVLGLVRWTVVGCGGAGLLDPGAAGGSGGGPALGR